MVAIYLTRVLNAKGQSELTLPSPRRSSLPWDPRDTQRLLSSQQSPAAERLSRDKEISQENHKDIAPLGSPTPSFLTSCHSSTRPQSPRNKQIQSAGFWAASQPHSRASCLPIASPELPLCAAQLLIKFRENNPPPCPKLQGTKLGPLRIGRKIPCEDLRAQRGWGDRQGSFSASFFTQGLGILKPLLVLHSVRLCTEMYNISHKASSWQPDHQSEFSQENIPTWEHYFRTHPLSPSLPPISTVFTNTNSNSSTKLLSKRP